jgi:hypothetical protein
MPERISDERARELGAMAAVVKPGDMMAADYSDCGTSVIEGDWEGRFCQCDVGDRKSDDESAEEHLRRAEYIAAMLNAAPLLLLDRADLKAENARLREIARHFIPLPSDMSGWDDPDAPGDVQELIRMAKEFWQ